VPIVKATIEGREYSFAPLLYGHIEDMADEETAKLTEIQKFKVWIPRVESSMERAGNKMPGLREMDLDQIKSFFYVATAAILEASGIKAGVPGEAVPAAASATK
jgi:hypothetical protein